MRNLSPVIVLGAIVAYFIARSRKGDSNPTSPEPAWRPVDPT